MAAAKGGFRAATAVFGLRISDNMQNPHITANSTLLITGGAGFIGSCFTLYMKRTHPGMRVICLDKLTYAADQRRLYGASGKPLSYRLSGAFPDRTAGGSPDFRFVKADICDREAVYRIFEEENIDIVVNFAAESHVDRSIVDSGVFLQTNVAGTGVLLDACRKYGIKRFHQVSTDEVYGDLPSEGPPAEGLPENLPREGTAANSQPRQSMFTESSPLHPNNPYSASKASADLLVLAFRRTYGLSVTVSRSCNNYGPQQHAEKLIPTVIENALKNAPIPVYGDGRNMRDWLYVEDCCRAIDMILHYGTDGEIYNIAAGNEIANIDLVRKILRELKKPETLIKFVNDRPGHDRRYTMESAKIRELGWKPEVGFEDGLKETIKWYAGDCERLSQN